MICFDLHEVQLEDEIHFDDEMLNDFEGLKIYFDECDDNQGQGLVLLLIWKIYLVDEWMVDFEDSKVQNKKLKKKNQLV